MVDLVVVILFGSLQLFKLYAQFKQLHINEPWSVLAGSQLVHVVGEVALEIIYSTLSKEWSNWT